MGTITEHFCMIFDQSKLSNCNSIDICLIYEGAGVLFLLLFANKGFIRTMVSGDWVGVLTSSEDRGG